MTNPTTTNATKEQQSSEKHSRRSCSRSSSQHRRCSSKCSSSHHRRSHDNVGKAAPRLSIPRPTSHNHIKNTTQEKDHSKQSCSKDSSSTRCHHRERVPRAERTNSTQSHRSERSRPRPKRHSSAHVRRPQKCSSSQSPAFHRSSTDEGKVSSQEHVCLSPTKSTTITTTFGPAYGRSNTHEGVVRFSPRTVARSIREEDDESAEPQAFDPSACRAVIPTLLTGKETQHNLSACQDAACVPEAAPQVDPFKKWMSEESARSQFSDGYGWYISEEEDEAEEEEDAANKTITCSIDLFKFDKHNKEGEVQNKATLQDLFKTRETITEPVQPKPTKDQSSCHSSSRDKLESSGRASRRSCEQRTQERRRSATTTKTRGSSERQGCERSRNSAHKDMGQCELKNPQKSTQRRRASINYGVLTSSERLQMERSILGGVSCADNSCESTCSVTSELDMSTIGEDEECSLCERRDNSKDDAEVECQSAETPLEILLKKEDDTNRSEHDVGASMAVMLSRPCRQQQEGGGETTTVVTALAASTAAAEAVSDLSAVIQNTKSQDPKLIEALSALASASAHVANAVTLLAANRGDRGSSACPQ